MWVQMKYIVIGIDAVIVLANISLVVLFIALNVEVKLTGTGENK